MITPAIASSLHMLGLALTFGSIFMRARLLRRGTLAQVFVADTLWGVSFLLMLGSGLWRAFGGLEKGSEYYLHSSAFYVKMTLLGVILAVEVWPMVTFINWRIKAPSDTSKMRVFAIISDCQTLLAMAMVVAASLMARGH